MPDDPKKPEASAADGDYGFEPAEDYGFEPDPETPAPAERKLPDKYYGKNKNYGEVKQRIAPWESTAAGLIKVIPGATKMAARVHSWLDPNVSYEESKQVMESGQQEAVDVDPGRALFGQLVGGALVSAALPGGAVMRGAGALKQLAGTAGYSAALSAGEQDWTAPVDATWNVVKDVGQNAALHGTMMGIGKGVQAVKQAGKEKAIIAAKNALSKEAGEEARAYGFKTKDLTKSTSKSARAAVLRDKAAATEDVAEAAKALTKADNMEKSIPMPWIKENIQKGPWREMYEQSIKIEAEASDAIGSLLKSVDQEYGKAVQGGKIVRPQIYNMVADDIAARNPTAGQQEVVGPVIARIRKEAENAAKRGGYTLDEAYASRSAWAKLLAKTADQEKAAALRASVDAIDDIIEGHVTRVAPDMKGKLDELKLDMSQAIAAGKAFNSKIVEKMPRWSATVDSVKDSLLIGGAKPVLWVESKLRSGKGQEFGKYADELALALRKNTLVQTIYMLTRKDPEFAEQVRKGTTKETE